VLGEELVVAKSLRTFFERRLRRRRARPATRARAASGKAVP
jgi:hypothetical protein